MKTRRLEIAAERGRVGDRSAQAWGFVSRIMVRRDGGGSIERVVSFAVVCGRMGWGERGRPGEVKEVRD